MGKRGYLGGKERKNTQKYWKSTMIITQIGQKHPSERMKMRQKFV